MYNDFLDFPPHQKDKCRYDLDGPQSLTNLLGY